MSKLYTKYLECKRKDDTKMYLFKAGIFYCFIDEDAKEMNRITLLKCVPLTGEIVKCGFPENAKDKYMNILNEIGKEVEIVTLDHSPRKVENVRHHKSIQKLLQLDINQISPIEALNLLSQIKMDIANQKEEENEKQVIDK